jgi:glycosyltransferase involved in cell wall biosynthesis
MEFTIVSDTEPDSTGIRVVDTPEASLRWVRCRTVTLASRFFWHPDLLALVRREKPDAVITTGNPYVLTAWVLLAWGSLSNVPVVLWTHGLLRKESGLKGLIRRTFYGLASGLLLYGDHARMLLTDAGFDPRRMFVVYNSLDSETQRQYLNTITSEDRDAFRSGLGVGDKDRLLLFSGRLQANKKLNLLLDAVHLLRERERTVHIALIGDGEERAALTHQAERLGIATQVHFLGETYDERLIAIACAASDLSVVPSGAGLSVVHALGYGLPVLLHDRPEEHFPEWEAVREGQTGFFYRYGNVNDMADKIESALFPKSRTETLKAACLALVRNRYSTHTHACAIISAVKTVASQQP